MLIYMKLVLEANGNVKVLWLICIKQTLCFLHLAHLRLILWGVELGLKIEIGSDSLVLNLWVK